MDCHCGFESTVVKPVPFIGVNEEIGLLDLGCIVSAVMPPSSGLEMAVTLGELNEVFLGFAVDKGPIWNVTLAIERVGSVIT